MNPQIKESVMQQQSPELLFIFHALQAAPSPMKPDINPRMDWNLLYQLTLRHRVWYQVCAALLPLRNDLPALYYDRLAQYCQRDTMRILATAAETVRIASAFTKHFVFYCFIKGIVLNAQIYDTLASRPCKDIDVWVEPSTYQQATAILESLGYQKTLPTYDLKGFQERYYMRHKHDMTFYHAERKIVVELHFKLACFGHTFFSPTAEITKSITLFNTQILTLTDDYHLLYLMTHAAVHAWTRLRWLNDIVLYIKSGSCDLQQVMVLAKSIQCEHIVEQSLLLVQENFGREDETLSQLIPKPSQRGVKIARIAQSFINSDYELIPESSVNNKMFFLYRFYWATLAPPGKKLKIIIADWFKIDYLFPQVRFPDQLSFLYYIIYPFWIIKRLIARNNR